MPVDNPGASAQSVAFEARQLVRAASIATLATIDRATGAPYASLVQVATEPDTRPLLLISRLARHTQNIAADPRVSLLVDQRVRGENALAAFRTTLIGRAVAGASDAGRARFLRRHPGAASYAGFADFGFWSIEIDAAHTIAGFGRILEIPGDEIRLDAARQAAIAAIAAAEDGILARLEWRLATDMPASVRRFVVSLDIEGVDVRSGADVVRHAFAAPAGDPAAAELAASDLLKTS